MSDLWRNALPNDALVGREHAGTIAALCGQMESEIALMPPDGGLIDVCKKSLVHTVSHLRALAALADATYRERGATWTENHRDVD